jgi:lysophospholipase
MLVQHGWNVVAIDWRGQGYSERPEHDPMQGYVDHFAQYQQDIDALIEYAKSIDLPKPWNMVGHSMGGCIGLRALHRRGDDFDHVTFSAPMWGIEFGTLVNPFASTIAKLGVSLGFAKSYVPSASSECYLLTGEFDRNRLTNDPENWRYMVDQVKGDAELRLGGPSFSWVNAAVIEMNDLMSSTPPNVPAMTLLGTDEAVVSSKNIRDYMNKWDNGILLEIQNGRHEVLMERSDLIQKLIRDIDAFFHDDVIVEGALIAAE